MNGNTPRKLVSENCANALRQRGSAMVLAIFVLVLLSGMGVALLFLSELEMKMSTADLRGKKSFFLAESGLEDGRETLFQANGKGDFSDDLANAAGSNGLIDFDPSALLATYDASGNFTGFTGYGDDVPLRVTTPFGDGNYTAFLTNDAIDIQTLGAATASVTDTNKRVTITGVGIGPERSMEIVQGIIKPWKPLPALPMATITLLGPTPDFEGGTSNRHEYHGDDCLGAGQPGLYVPTVGAIGPAAEASTELGISQPNGPDYISDPAMTNPEDTIADLTDMTDSLVRQPVDSTWTDCLALKDMIEVLRAKATHLCVGDGCAMPAGLTSQDITFIDDGIDPSYSFDVGPGDPDGAGILVDTGHLNFHGRREWTGIVLVIGRGEIVRNGSGNGAINGTLIVADIAGPDDIYGTADDCTGGDGGFDVSEYEVTGGGVGNTNYCSNTLNDVNTIRFYELTEFIQR